LLNQTWPADRDIRTSKSPSILASRNSSERTSTSPEHNDLTGDQRVKNGRCNESSGFRRAVSQEYNDWTGDRRESRSPNPEINESSGNQRSASRNGYESSGQRRSATPDSNASTVRRRSASPKSSDSRRSATPDLNAPTVHRKSPSPEGYQSIGKRRTTTPDGYDAVEIWAELQQVTEKMIEFGQEKSGRSHEIWTKRCCGNSVQGSPSPERAMVASPSPGVVEKGASVPSAEEVAHNHVRDCRLQQNEPRLQETVYVDVPDSTSWKRGRVVRIQRALNQPVSSLNFSFTFTSNISLDRTAFNSCLKLRFCFTLCTGPVRGRSRCGQ